MNYLMIGHSSAGKTTFMAALYYRMKESAYDYTMSFDVWANYFHKNYVQKNNNYDLNEAKKEKEELDMVSKNVVNGIYPPPTSIKQEYVFTMRYKKQNGVKFNWIDYRGGALMERSSENADTKELILKVKKSDALIVFLDGPKLEEPLCKNEGSFRRLIYLVKKAIAEVEVGEGYYFPVSFVITKDDLCQDVLNSEGFNYFLENLITDISQSKKVAGLITWATVNKEHIFNVHWPLFFSINHSMYKFINETISNYLSRDNDRGFFASIKEWWTDEDKNWTKKVINDLQGSRVYIQKILNEGNHQYFYLI